MNILINKQGLVCALILTLLTGIPAYAYFHPQMDTNGPSSAPKPSNPGQASQEKKECAICLEEIAGKVTPLKNCDHIFHKDCIETWVKGDIQKNMRGHDTCPVCRKPADLGVEIVVLPPDEPEPPVLTAAELAQQQFELDRIQRQRHLGFQVPGHNHHINPPIQQLRSPQKKQGFTFARFCSESTAGLILGLLMSGELDAKTGKNSTSQVWRRASYLPYAVGSNLLLSKVSPERNFDLKTVASYGLGFVAGLLMPQIKTKQ